MARKIEDLTGAELALLDRERTVILFVTASLEDHGPHLPLSLRMKDSEHLARELAAGLEAQTPPWSCVLMPASTLGVQSVTTRLALTVRAHVLRDWLVDQCMALHRAGFRNFVCVSSQLTPRQVVAIEDAGRLVRRRAAGGLLGRLKRGFQRGTILIPAASNLVNPDEVKASPLWPDPKEHGGERDTSVALALDLARPEASTLPPLERQEPRWQRFKSRRAGSLGGYWGAPAAGTREKGQILLAEQVKQLLPPVRASLDGSPVDGHFKSWYSVFPPNGSFFAAWVLSVALTLLLLFWFYFTFTMMVEPG